LKKLLHVWAGKRRIVASILLVWALIQNIYLNISPILSEQISRPDV
jgi:hypothetical protein